MDTAPETLNRAFSFIEAKAFDDEKRTFRGLASTPEPDRMLDIIEPSGATWKNPVVLLHAHDHSRPIGSARLGPATARGIEFEATIAKIAEPGPLKDRVDTAWGEVSSGIVRAVSIGFIPAPGPDSVERLETGGLRYKRISIIELSTVAVPANASATIQVIRSIDAQARAAAGHVVRLAEPARPVSRAAALRDEIRDLQARQARLLPNIRSAHASGDGDTHHRLICADDALSAEIRTLQSRAANLSAGLDEFHGLHLPGDAQKALESRLEALERRFESKLAEAEARARKAVDHVWKAMPAALAGPVKEFLDERVGDAPLRYGGVHQRALAYRKGTVVSDRGGAWVAVKDIAPGERPGETDSWQLFVRAGRDGKDAIPKETTR